MEKTEVKNKVNRIVADVLQIDVKTIKETDSPETIDKWTSLFHVLIIDNIEKEFEISFNFDELIEIESVKDIYNSLENKL